MDKVDIQGYLTFYEDIAPAKADSFLDGTAQYVSMTLGMKQFGVMLNYWDAHQYIAPLGEPLYQSKSRVYPGDYVQYRKMAMVRLMYEAKIWPNLYLVARMNNIFNLSENQYDNVMEIYCKFFIGRSFDPKKLYLQAKYD